MSGEVPRPRYRESCRKGCVAARNCSRTAVPRLRYREFRGKGCIAARNRRKNAASCPRHREFCGKVCVAARNSSRAALSVRDTGNLAEKGVSLRGTAAEQRFPSAIQVISRKRVCRCTNPLHEPSARTLCTEPLRRTAARNRYAEPRHGLKGKLRFAFCCRRGRVRNCF